MEIEQELKELEKMESEEKAIVIDEPKPLKTKETTPTKLSYKEQRLLETLPTQIEQLEQDIKALKACLSNPECYQQKGLTALSHELETKEAALEPLIEELLLIEEKVEMMQRG